MEIENLLREIELKKRLDPTGPERIARVLAGEEVDRLPLIFWRPKQPTTYDMAEQFYDKRKMLHANLEQIAACCQDAFDAPLCLRPEFGTVFMPAMFGLEFAVFKDTYPWITRHLTKEEVMKLTLPDLDKPEMMQRALEYIAFFREMLPDYIHVYLPDTQGPFAIAHLVYGENIFYDFYDDPAFVHRLLELCTELYLQVTARLKRALGEPDTACFHGHALPRGIYMRNGGTRISEDSATLIAPAQIEEFVLPYAEKALSAFGGGFVHYCGKNDHLLAAFLKMKEVRAINLGNPEMHNFHETMRAILAAGKCYFGTWPRLPGEDLPAYIDRMMSVTDGGRRGLVLLFDETAFPESPPEEVLSLWEEKSTSWRQQGSMKQ
ncbi:MAG: uroporphyrinogen decarboxylase family protein [Bacillota bacterium]